METIFWADQIAENILNRKRYNYINKEVKYKEPYVIKSSTSISGVPHIGNASDVLRHDAVIRALIERGKKVEFIWVGEDMDPFRKVPANLPKHLSKYLGMPVADVPCPDGCCKTYSEHFCNLFINSLRESYGTNPKFISTAQTYRKGDFAKDVIKIMKNLDKVREIVNKAKEEEISEDWNPYKPVCDNCGKLITTVVLGTDGESVDYECKDYSFKEYGKDAYTKVEGCGHKGTSEIKKGNGKLLWRVEWGMLWNTWKVCLEGGGKEHFMPSGSFWSAGEVCEKILDWPEPFPGKNPIQPYEYITVDGEKMSASKGNTVATWEWPNFAPPETLRLLFLKRPNKHRDFKYDEIFKLVDEFDELEKLYFDISKLDNEKEVASNKRLYELSSIDEIKGYTNPIPFTFLAVLSQITKNFNETLKKLKEFDYDTSNEKLIEKRFSQAKEWVNLYGPDYLKFEIQEKVSENIKKQLTKEQVESLKILSEKLNKKYTEKELFEEFYNICKEVNIKNTDFFKGAYLVLIGKEKGPRLSHFILTIGNNKVKELINQV